MTYGAGSIYRRTSDGMWIGTLEAGWTKRGTRRRITVSSKNRRTALNKLRERQREIARTGLPPESAVRVATVKSWADTWLARREREVSPHSFTADRSAVVTWIVPTLGRRHLDRLSGGDVRALIDAVRDAGRAAGTVRRTHQVLMTMLHDALAEGLVVPPAALAVPKPGVGKSERGAIPLGDVAKILTQARSRADVSRWLAAFYMGLRPAEALGLTWDSIDLDAGTATIEWQLATLRYKVKGDRSSGFRAPDGYEARQISGAIHLVRPKTRAGRRVVPLVGPMLEELALWRTAGYASPHGLVWPEPDGTPGRDSLDRKRWRALCEAAEVGKTTADGKPAPYDLYEARHTCASTLRASGVDDQTITAIMGHSSIKSTEAYIHIDLEQARKALAGAMSSIG